MPSQNFFLVLAVFFTVMVVGRLLMNFVRLRRTGFHLGPWDAYGMFTVLNLLLFWWITALLGGDALNGKVVGDQHFLGSHGRYTPVSFPVYLYSAIHGAITLATFALMFVVALYRVFTGRARWQLGKKLSSRGKGTV